MAQEIQRTKSALRIHKRIRQRVSGHARASAPGCLPQRDAHLRAGDRRSARATRWSPASSTEKDCAEQAAATSTAPKLIGKLVAERAKEKGISKVVFDRGGYLYHGRVKALADAAREAGLEF